MWLAFATGYLKRYNLLKNAMWQLLIVSIGSILWDIFTGWHRWSVDLVLPLVCLIVEILMELIARSPVTSAKRIYDLLCNGIGLQHGTASDSDGDRCDLVPCICSYLCGLKLFILYKTTSYSEKKRF